AVVEVAAAHVQQQRGAHAGAGRPRWTALPRLPRGVPDLADRRPRPVHRGCRGLRPGCVAGGIPRALAGNAIAQDARLHREFRVLAGGRVLVRSGTVDCTGHRPLELVGAGGELERSWLLAPAEEHGPGVAVDPRDPKRMLSWTLV